MQGAKGLDRVPDKGVSGGYGSCPVLGHDLRKRRAAPEGAAVLERHGLLATQEAFGVSRRTLFAWQAQLRRGRGKPHTLTPGSTRPRRLRQRQWSTAVVQEIRRLRTAHPNLGKEKLHPFIVRFCRTQGLKAPSVRTIGRLIADAPDEMRHARRRVSRFPQGRVARRPRERKPKGYRPEGPGDCIAWDSIERRLHGMKRHLITCTDLASRFAFAYGVKSLSSQQAYVAWQAAPGSLPRSRAARPVRQRARVRQTLPQRLAGPADRALAHLPTHSQDERAL